MRGCCIKGGIKMSVRKNERKQGQLQVLNKSRELVSYIIKILTNEEVFPKKYRWTLVSKISDEGCDLITSINRANAVKVETQTDFEYRRFQQKQARGHLEAMMSLITIAYDVFPASAKKMNYVGNLEFEIIELLNKWMKSDKERFVKSVKIKEAEQDVVLMVQGLPSVEDISIEELKTFIKELTNKYSKQTLKAFTPSVKKECQKYILKYKEINK